MGVNECIFLCSGCTFGSLTHEKKLLPARQQGHVAHLFLCFQGGLGDRGDLGDQEDQQVQPGLGHPDQNKQNKKNRRIRERNTIFNHGKEQAETSCNRWKNLLSCVHFLKAQYVAFSGI